MKFSLVLLLLTLTACINTAWFAPEYDQQYYLAEDVNVYTAYSFTGIKSVWFTGPQKIETIASTKIPVAASVTLKKNSPVKILELFTVSGIDASSSEAKLQIVDTDLHTVHIVYINWPGSKALLTTQAGPHRN